MEDQKKWLDSATEYSQRIEKDEELKKAKKAFYSVNRKAMKEGMKVFHKEVFNYIVKMNMISFDFYIDIFYTTFRYSNNNLLNAFYMEIKKQQVNISDADIYGIFNLYSLWNSYIGFVSEYRLLISLQYALKSVDGIEIVSNDWLDYNHKVDIQVINHNTKKILNIQVKISTWLSGLNGKNHTKMVEKLRRYERILKESDVACDYDTISAFVFSHEENREIVKYSNLEKSLIPIDNAFWGRKVAYVDYGLNIIKPSVATTEELIDEVKIAIGVITEEEIKERIRLKELELQKGEELWQQECERVRREYEERKRQEIWTNVAS